MKKKMSKKTILLIVGIILLFSITLGSAILSSLLSIEGNTTIKENSWVIYFDSVRKSSDSVASSNDAKITNYEKTRIDFSANLKEPGDFYEFTVYTVNDGTIDAMVDSVEKFELTEDQQKYLDFSVTYDNGRQIKRCDPLDAGTRKRIKAIVKFKDGIDLSNYSTEDVNLDLYFDIHYVQKDDACPPDPTGNEHILTLRPHGGTYKKRTDETRIYIEPGQTYEIEDPTRYLYNFTGWEKILPETEGTYTFENNIFTMGDEDVTLEAQWEEGAYVARIMNKYYTSIQEAFDAVDTKDWEDNTVYLLKNQNEDPINNATNSFVFNLGGYNITGKITNPKTGNIRLVNGKITAESDQAEAFLNYGTVTLGTQGGGVQVENSIAIIGNEVGLRNIKSDDNVGDFYFYDGYIEAVAALVGGYTDKEENYYIFSEHIVERNDQRIYLVRNPNRAVAKTTTEGVIYYYNLQDAINQASINKSKENLTDDDYIISAVRNFEAAYKLQVKDTETIIFDLDGHTITTGDTITNNGNFTIKNTAGTASTIKPSKTITNTANLNISNVAIRSSADENTINNSGALNLNKTNIQAKGGYGIINTDNGTISMDTNTTIASTNTYGIYNSASNLMLDNGTVYGIYNSNKITLTGTLNPQATGNVVPIYNTGTAILNNLEINQNINKEIIYTNQGNVTINGGKITNRDNVFDSYYGSITINGAELKSTNAATVAGSASATLNSGKVESTSTTAITTNSLTMNDGEVTGVGHGVSVSSLKLVDGTITSDGIGASTSSANIQGGTINGVTYGLDTNSVTMSNGTINSSEGVGINSSSATITGGTVNGATYGVSTNSITMSNGTINSKYGIGVLSKTEATITGGTITGDTYGVQSKNKITLGVNEAPISSTSPVLVGNLYGLYLEGNDNNFYDGILKGQTDGYYGKITGLPTGGLVIDGTEEINEITYNTDTVNAYKNWLQVGDDLFNNIESACDAIESTGTITVIDDADVRFIQQFINNSENEKNITFDLNGHTITTTQPIYNHTKVTIVDSSNEKDGKIIANRVEGIVNANDGELTINSGSFETTTTNYAINNNGVMTINAAYVTGPNTPFRTANNLTINDITIENATTGIYLNGGTIEYNGGSITATDTGISKGSGTVTVNGGTIYGTNYGIGGSDGNAVINDGLVKAKTNNALYTYYGELRVKGGQVISEENIAMQSHSDMYVDGGYVEGTKGIQNEQYCSWYSCWYNDINVTGGHIVGTVEDGIYARAESTGELTITGGTIEGKINGVNTIARTRIGSNNNNVSTTTPVLIGHTDYGLLHTNYTEFYDGILKGIKDGHHGLISIIPDGYLIKDDYEYIDRVEYQTDYLVEKGNWLRVGNKEFNSINKANQYITEDNRTMTVIADAYVDFEQAINANYDVVFDFNGHSLIMTQPIQVKSNTRFTNTREVGGINNLRDNAMTISGVNVIIDAGVYHSDVKTTITNSGTLTINGGEIKADKENALSSSGTVVVNGGTISGENQASGISASSNLTINQGNVLSQNQTAIGFSSGTITVNGGTIKSTKSYSLSASDSNLTINNGLIQSEESSAITTSNSYYGTQNVEIKNGQIIGNVNGVVSDHSRGTTTINGGHITGETGSGLVTITTTYLNDGNIEGDIYGVHVKSDSNITYIGNNDGTINIDTPTLKGNLYGLFTSSSNSVHFYDGIIKGITGRHSGIINTIATHSQIFEDEEVIDEETYLTEYLVTETEIVINEDTGETYGNLQTAITQAQDGETLRLLTNVPLYYEIAVVNNPNITLDLDGKTISTNKQWRVTVPFTITNTSNQEATMKISTAINLISNTDTLTINNVTLKNNSSSNYVLNNTAKLNLNNVKIDCINGVQSSNELNINNSTIRASSNTISNTGKMTINGGTYTGGNYSIYSNSAKTVDIANASFNGVAYNAGNNTATMINTTVTGNLQNNTSNLTIENSNINTGRVTNNGTMTLIDSTFTATTTNYDYYYYQDVAMANSGTLTLDHSNVLINQDAVGKSSYAISNTGELNVTNNSKVYNGTENSSYTYRAINTSSNGLTTISDSEVKVTGGTTNYALYIDGANAKAILLTGMAKSEEASTGYGVYIDKGTFEMGHYEGQGVTQEDVSITNPLVLAEGKSRGIGVKKVNASFNFYDGKIRASKYAKPETTTNVEYQFEVTTYVEMDTGYEYAILEWMRNDYQGDTVCLLNDVYYKSVQDAIDKASAGDEIVLLKSVEENLTIPTNKNFKLNLNQHSITTKVTNNGTFNVYNGSLQSFDDTTIVNRGTLILGEDDNTVSSSNIRIVSESTTIQSTGTIIMYDGYIEGTEAIDGKINQIAQYSRVRTVHDEQSEKKFIQSLSPEAIQNGETDLIITIDPNNGLYEESKEVKEIFKKYHETYTLSTPTKRGCNFIGWELSEDAVFDEQTNTITVDISDVTATAKWEVSSDAVAKVGEEYYLSLQEALDNASDNDTVELLKNTTEDITNKSNVKLDLGGYKVTGAFINQGELRIVNGTIENPSGVGMINQKLLTMGENDGEIHEDSVQIIGTTVGLQQDAIFRFYDGYIEGDIALNGRVDSVPKGYFLYNDRNNTKNCQRVYLIGNPENAVAVIENGGTQYFFSLQSAIDTATITGDEIFIVRDFEAAYAVNVPEEANILLNMNGHDITIGNTITNNGTLRIYDSTEEIGSITTAKTITNNGTLTVESIEIKQTTTEDTILNNGTLNLTGSTITGQGYAVRTNGPMTMGENAKVTRTDGSYAIYNNYDGLTLESGETSGIYNAKTLTVGGDFAIKSTHTNSACVHSTTANAHLTMNGGTCTAENIGISLQGQNQTFEMNDGVVKSNSGISVYVSNTNGANTVTINNGEIESKTNNAIYLYGRAHNLTINDGTITTQQSSTAVWTASWSSSTSDRYNVDINGGIITGANYGVGLNYTNLNITGGEIITTSTDRDRYALYINYGNSTVKDVEITADNASGIYANGPLTVEDTIVNASKSTSYGIFVDNTTVNVKDGTIINTPGTSSSGIMMGSTSNNTTLNFDGGTINSGSVGINTANNYTKNINVKSGTIIGEIYGIKLSVDNATLTVGENDATLSTTDPMITGGLYGIYKTAGKMNFYSGLLRGYTYGYNDDFYDIRKSKDITEEAEAVSGFEKILTYSGTNVSETPTTKYAKSGNGHARITYIGEDTDNCVSGEATEISYTGEEQTYTATCPGEYKLEVWGAQGGSYNSTYHGGYGGYSTGKITLQANETLYINVGGQGSSGLAAIDGGYNGGGASFGSTCSGYNSRYGASGGGATHIATTSGILSSLENNKDSIIMVAGGGGGSHYYSAAYGSGASGGGYKGATATWTNSGHPYYVQPSGGTQTAGGQNGYSYSGNSMPSASFGQGSSYNGATCNEGSGGGGGYYGGGSGQFAPGAGGSGYIGNERLSDQYMYGYDVEATHNEWIKNYLVDKDNFLQVNDQLFNSIDTAVEYIVENLNGTGTIKLLKDATIQEDSTFTANTTITFDLNGKTLQSTRTLVNLGNLTIIDSTEEKTGFIYNKNSTAIANKLNLHVVNGKIQSDNGNGITGDTNDGTLTIDEGVIIKGIKAINTTTNYTININNANIIGTTNAVVSTGPASKLTVTDSTLSTTSADTIEVTGASSIVNITSSNLTAGDDGVTITGNNATLTIEDTTINASSAGLNIANRAGTSTITNSTITGRDYGLYINSYSMNINLTDNTIKSTNAVAIHDVYTSNNGRNTITLSGGTVEGKTHAIYTNYSNLTTSDVTIKTTSTNNGHYCIYTNYNSPTITINEGTELLAPNASGIRNITTTIINAGEIKAEGTSSYGIVNSSSGTLNVYGGTIYAGKYGIYQNSTNSTTTIGDSETPLSIDTPVIEGGEYGIYTESGKSNFYSGRLKGKTNSYNGNFYRVRKAHTIYTFDEVIDLEQPDVTREVSYLTETEGFLQVGDDPTNVYNTFEDAIAAVQGTTGTITVLNDKMIYESIEFPTDKDITLYLNDHVLTMTQTITNKGTLTIVGGDDLSKNSIINNTSEGITNKGILNLNKVDLETTSVGIRGNTGTNPITITDSKVRAKTAIQIDTAQPLTITNSEIEGTNGNAITQSAGSQKTVIINSKVTASDYAIRQSGGSCITEIKDSNILGTSSAIYQTGNDATIKVENTRIRGNNYGIYSSGYRDIINVLDNTKIEGGDIGIYQDRNASSDYSTITIDKTDVVGKNYGVYIRGAELNTTNTNVENLSTDVSKYSALCGAYSRCNFGNNTEIKSESASGIYANTYYDLNLNNTTISTNAKNGNGINAYDGTININEGTTITTTGYQSNGVYQSDYDAIVNLNGGEINSKNIGVYLGNNRNDTKVLNINKGQIIGEVYGVSQTCSNATTNIGNLNDEVSITDPYIEGGLISVNKANGTLNFYSGRLKGYIRGNPGTVDVVREGYEIFDDEDEAQIYIRSQKTISVTDHADTPIANTAKEGNGYAKVTYEEYEDTGDINENNEEVISSIGLVSEQNNTGSSSQSTVQDNYTYEYTGNAQTFIVPETGLYKFETWGAQGGYSLCNGSKCNDGGLGGYSSGTMYLEAGTTLYIYVGGHGTNGVVGQNSNGGYNGGGGGSSDGSDDETSGGGGGATDIRLIGGEWNDQTSLASRIMIAAGGGGASWSYTAGQAGGLSGYSHYSNVSPAPTQVSGYAFGIGQTGVGAADSDGVAGGGGGYYGGTTSNTSGRSAGAGGSSYISGHAGSVAIKAIDIYTPRLDSHGDECYYGTTDATCSVHYSNYIFANTTMIDGAGYTWTTEKGEYVGQTQPDGSTKAGHSGDGYAKISFLGSYDREYDYTGQEETFTAPLSGFYTIETWGAQGGGTQGGYGSYSVGKINLNAGDKLYINVGGTTDSSIAGYNGGGTANGHYGGGGATHIATKSGLLKNLSQDIEDIIIVSGGGGGTGGNWGGHAGGIQGQMGTDGACSNKSGFGGTQTAGGTCPDLSYGNAGTFGEGGSWKTATNGGAGGGGFYGGGSGTSGGCYGGGGGGSGYIGNDRLTEKHMTCYECQTSDDNATRTISNSNVSVSPIAENSKRGNGYAKITYNGGSDIGSDTHVIKLESEYGTIENSEIVYNDGDTLGNIPQPVVDSENLEFMGWYENNIYTKKVDENTIVYMSATLYAKFNYTPEYCRTIEGTLTSSFDYTGDEEMYQVLCPGKYKLEVWGAQGGSTKYNSYENTGGYGGYSIGHTSLKQNEKLYINVGGKGNSVDYQQSTGSSNYTFDNSKGYNGGGFAIVYVNNSAHAGGGGATHIATRRGLLSTLSRYKEKVLIVAGGGGGSATHKSYPNYSGDGGSGGGAVAGSGTPNNTTCYNYGTGGSQNETGTYVRCESDGNTNRSNSPANPAFGIGSNYTANDAYKEYAGGGSGWYGGQSGHHAPGGGGSSYVNERRLEDTAMYGYNIEEAYTNNKSNIAYLIEKRDLIVNLTTDETYVNLQDAIDDANNGDTLQYIANDYIAYTIDIPQGKNIIIDLNGYNVVESKQIVNNGNITITNSSTEYSSKITNNASITQFVNNGILSLENIKVECYNGVENGLNANLLMNNAEISASNTGINTTGKMTLEASTIYGATYDIYSNSEKTELISNTTLKQSSNAYYKYNNGDTTITDSTVRGPINNARSGQPLEVKDSVITSYIRNTGNSTYTNNEVTATIGNESNSLIYNTGTINLIRNDLEFKSTSTNSGSYDNTMIENRGTITTTNNDYLLRYDYNGAGTYSSRRRYLYQIKNYGLLTSTDDEFTTIGGEEMYTFYNNSTNQSIVENATINQHYGSSTSRILHNEAGNFTIKDSTAENYDTNNMYGVYLKAGNVNITNTNINIHDSNGGSSKTSYGFYINSGSLTYDRGTMSLLNVYNAYGSYIKAGNFEFKDGTMNLSGNTTSYGVYVEDANGTYTQGIYDGRGTEDADVSSSSPNISAIGATTGIGVRKGGGTFNYYDGYITGSTSPRQSGDITSSTELNYQVVTKHNSETGYDYCILEYDR